MTLPAFQMLVVVHVLLIPDLLFPPGEQLGLLFFFGLVLLQSFESPDDIFHVHGQAAALVCVHAVLSQHVGRVNHPTGILSGDCFLRLLAAFHVRKCPITPQLLDGPFRLLFWELLQIRVPDHDLADTVVSAM